MTRFKSGQAAAFRLLLGLALLTTTWLTLTPNPAPLPVDHADKLLHAGTFLLLAFLADAGWPERNIGWRPLALLALYGAGIEIAQQFVPNRLMSAGDLIANLAGLALYARLISPWLRRGKAADNR